MSSNTSSNTYLTRIVGTQFRAAGSAVMSCLSEGTPLILQPEPENQYDPDAIKVMVSTENTPLDILPSVIHIGYVPRKGNPRTDTMGISNLEVNRIMQDHPTCRAELTFDPAGNPLVRITTGADQ